MYLSYCNNFYKALKIQIYTQEPLNFFKTTLRSENWSVYIF